MLDPPIGRTWPAQSYEVGLEKIREYAGAIGADSPLYTSRDAAARIGLRDVVAPPLFAAVYCAPAVASVMFDPAVGLFDPAAGLASYRFVQRRQTFEWHQPVHSGDRITTVATLIDAGERNGQQFRVFASTSENQDGALVASGEYEGVVPGREPRRPSGNDGEEEAKPDALREVRPASVLDLRPGDSLPPLHFTPDRYAPIRYAGASGDFTPIHLDPEFARAFGLPGVILHGLYTFAQLARGLLAQFGDDPRLLRKLSARFRAPALPERELSVIARTQGAPRGSRVLSCEARQQGRPVLDEAEAILCPVK